ncbi:heavy-metal-associated domain-containing protein [Clostridium paraputrificum]|uniref:heavy-metal-associated domain-containing protein n=1 Tax=Clostridium TaxID=1485 RepID=UPI003D33D4F5
MAKFKVEISGMSCMHCVGHIKTGLEDSGKVTSMEVKIGEAVVEGNITEAEIKEIVEEEGFDVVSIETV